MPTILIMGSWFFSFMCLNIGNGAKKSSHVTAAAELMLDTLMLMESERERGKITIFYVGQNLFQFKKKSFHI